MASLYQHRPVLVEQSLALLGVGPGARVVDATVGGAGHSEAILERSAPDGWLLALDVDDEALTEAARRLHPFGDRVQLVRESFRRLGNVLSELEIESIDAALLDLGVSSRFLDSPERGFRFSEDAAAVTPLDMRMDRRQPRTAADLLASASVRELESWFREYGELPGAARLARTIADERRRAPLATTADLLRVIAQAGVGRGRRHHPATLVFQALRIAVNDELGALAEGIEAATAALRPGGRLVVISYHSLEDRLVKRALRDAARGCICPPRTPMCVCGRQPRLRVLTRRPVYPEADEIRANPRARSARLRAAEALEAVA